MATKKATAKQWNVYRKTDGYEYGTVQGSSQKAAKAAATKKFGYDRFGYAVTLVKSNPKKRAAKKRKAAAAPKKRKSVKAPSTAARNSHLVRNAGKLAKKVRGAKPIKSATVKKAISNARRAKKTKPNMSKPASNAWRSKRGGAKKPVRKNSGSTEKASERYEYFHGQAPDAIHDVIEERIEQSVHSGIGRLIALEVYDHESNLHEVNGFGKDCLLTQDLDGTQLFIVGGDQSLDPEDFGIETNHLYEVLGAVKSVTYDTNKVHLGSEGGKAHYKHEFGDEGGVLPVLIYDTANEEMMLAGGSYSIPSQGIAD